MHRELLFGDGNRAVWGNQPFPQGVNHFIQPCSKGIIGKEAVPGLMRGTPSET